MRRPKRKQRNATSKRTRKTRSRSKDRAGKRNARPESIGDYGIVGSVIHGHGED